MEEETYGIGREKLIKNKIAFPVYLTGDKEEKHITYTDTLEIESLYQSDNELTEDGYTLIAYLTDPSQGLKYEEVFMVYQDYDDFVDESAITMEEAIDALHKEQIRERVKPIINGHEPHSYEMTYALRENRELDTAAGPIGMRVKWGSCEEDYSMFDIDEFVEVESKPGPILELWTQDGIAMRKGKNAAG